MTSPDLATASSGLASAAAAATAVGRGRLALYLQESMTAVTRLRADRQHVTDAATFRAQMIDLLRRAEGQATAGGYEVSDVRLAVFAVVALLDESVLNTGQPQLAEWARRPLQEELFGGHMAGEWFFQYIDQMLARPDSPGLIDLLEVFQLCLLLGFRGRYGAGDVGTLHAVASRIGDRIGRARGAAGDLVPDWQPPNDVVAGRDPWIRRLAVTLVVCVVLAGVCYGVAMMSLGNAATAVGALAPAAPASPPSVP